MCCLLLLLLFRFLIEALIRHHHRFLNPFLLSVIPFLWSNTISLTIGSGNCVQDIEGFFLSTNMDSMKTTALTHTHTQTQILFMRVYVCVCALQYVCCGCVHLAWGGKMELIENGPVIENSHLISAYSINLSIDPHSLCALHFSSPCFGLVFISLSAGSPLYVCAMFGLFLF